MDKHKMLLKQNELRRLMKAKSSTAQVEKINSPIAKYDSKNNLSCVICKLPVKPAAWKVHINSKQHKSNVEKLQENLKKDPVDLKTQILKQTPGKPNSSGAKSIEVKDGKAFKEPTAKKEEQPPQLSSKPVITEPIEKENSSAAKNEQTLPENFFDPKPQSKTDAKDAIQEEWERFQKEIKEESLASNAIIAGEHEVATVDRQIEEIDEQIHLWSKVVSLEDKKKSLNFEHLKKSVSNIQTESNSEDEDMEEFEEFSNWRCKKF